MSYLLDKKIQQKKFTKIALGVVLLIILFYFRLGIWRGFSKVSEIIFHPILVLGDDTLGKFNDIGTYFVSKNYLYNQNQKLQAEVSFDDARMANYDSVSLDDASLKEILGRKDQKVAMVVSAILAKPNQSLYDTLLIDSGTEEGIKTGDTVFALGDVPIGSISDVYPNSAKVILFSNPGETTQAIISLGRSTGEANKPAAPVLNADGSPVTPPASVAPSSVGPASSSQGGNIFIEVFGRGGGNFEMVMPKNFVFQAGSQAVLPGINSYVLAIAQKVISDPRDPFTKVLLTSPVNIQDLKFVEVEQ